MSEIKPIIVIGMHRSGTSILSNILQKLGVCMGQDIIAHDESHSFQEMNIKLFKLFHATWDWPSPMEEYEHIEEAVKKKIIRYYSEKISSRAFMKKYGVDVFASHDSIFDKKYKLNIFGWKDPRNTYTLPIWLELFPDAKIINIYRNGIDVAKSLAVREQLRFKKGIDDNPLLSLRCLSLYGGFSLWTEYVREASKYENQMSDDQFLSVSYESLMNSSSDELSKIMNFIGVRKEKNYISEMSKIFLKDRAYSFLNNHDLIEFYLSIGRNNQFMSDLGFTKAIDEKLIRNG